MLLTACAVAWPLLLWSAVSYVPFLWHPDVRITDPGDVDYFQPDMLIDRATFAHEAETMKREGKAVPKGARANPVYLPGPVEVARAFEAAVTPGATNAEGEWLPSSFWHSVQTIFWGFLLSSVVGVPLGIVCGTYGLAARLIEPFVEFFRYLPAPAFGALCVAILGIYDAPKIAIIVIGTFFQQVLVIANTTRKLDASLVEAALTLGCKGAGLLRRVVVPGILPDLFRDQRILLGWAWTGRRRGSRISSRCRRAISISRTCMPRSR
jgi:NitT/TauT family transport system permease protein